MGFSGSGSSVTRPHTHSSSIVNDGGALNMDNVTQASLTAGDVIYSDGNALQRLSYPGSPAGETLTAAAASTAPSWAAGGGSAAFTPLGSDVETSAVSSLSVTGMTGHDVYQVIYSVCDEATGSPQNCYPCIRISNGGSTYDATFAQITASNQTGTPVTESTQDEWRLNKVSNGESWTGVIYIYAPNSHLSNGFVGTMMQHNNQTSAANIATGWGENDNTADITSVTFFFRTAAGAVIDCVGSLQVNGMNYS